MRSTSLLACLVLVAGGADLAPAQPSCPAPDYWVVHTRCTPQVLGTDPGPTLRALRLGPDRRLVPGEPAGLLAIAEGRPVVVLVHGSYYSAGHAAREGLRIRDDLSSLGAIPPDAVVVAFDWPSQRVYANPIRDGNEKGRRAFVAGYHLARFLQDFPPGQRVALVGHSHGGLAVLAALHLLGGGPLDDGGDHCPPVLLPAGGCKPRLRAVAIAAACDRQWLDPGERFDRALGASEGVLCLYNPLDPALVAHPLGKHSDHRRALGKSGLGGEDRARLGPLARRYRECDIAPLLGVRHTFHGTVEIPGLARSMAPYTWAVEPPTVVEPPPLPPPD